MAKAEEGRRVLCGGRPPRGAGSSRRRSVAKGQSFMTGPRGAIAAVGFDYLDVGRQTGRMVARVLRGEKPGDIPVEQAQTLQLAVNPAAAAAMGATLPEALVARADIIVK